VAGVLLAMFIPIRHEGESLDTPLERLEHALTPWVAFGIVPVFALANAGVDLRSSPGLFPSTVELGVFVGLVLGKPLGILGTCLAAVRLGWLQKPEGASWTMLGGVGLLAGIGFTMSLFIAQLAFGDAAQLASVKAAILLASATAGVAGFLWLRFAPGPVGRTS
jgi:NhaA family Na+:H+ antiporter